MEKNNINSLLKVNANGRVIVSDLKASVSSPGSIREMWQNSITLFRFSRVENQVVLYSIAKLGHTILKMVATMVLSVMILLGVLGFFPLAMISNNLLLDVMIPLSFYQGICVFALYYMWTPMKGWGSN